MRTCQTNRCRWPVAWLLAGTLLSAAPLQVGPVDPALACTSHQESGEKFGSDERLQQGDPSAMSRGLWEGRSAANNRQEYGAEGVQSWFDANRENDGAHNPVNPRAELKTHDPGLAALVQEVFGDKPWRYHHRRDRNKPGHLTGYDPHTVPTLQWPDALLAWYRAHQKEKRNPPATPETRPDPSTRGTPWTLHVLDAGSHGADGVRLHDANDDGLADLVTGWEEGGEVRLGWHPGHARAWETPWTVAKVGRAPAVEDAFLHDLDGDGRVDVFSASEGQDRSLRLHWGSEAATPGAWRTEVLPSSRGMMMWMFAVPFPGSDEAGLRIVAGGKGPGAQLGFWTAPQNVRELARWTWQPLREVGWIMSILPSDMDGDGDVDILFSDRRGPRAGCYWLENPGRGGEKPWKEHAVGSEAQEVMFLDEGDVDGDGLRDVVVAVKSIGWVWHRRLDAPGRRWEAHTIGGPDWMGTAKAVAVGDLDGDGANELAVSCENARAPRSGVAWFKRVDGLWQARDISGPRGVKFDLVALQDVDGDGDLDLLTCEEKENLGVLCYENPGPGPRQDRPQEPGALGRPGDGSG